MTEQLYEKYCAAGYRVTTDSRSIAGGEIFFALRGENFDGNEYALKALESGASLAVVRSDAGLPDDPRLFKVDDPFVALQELAVWHRNHVGGETRLPVIGLTGTNGKTTTKELIAAVLSRKFNVTATAGNFNNDIGVPLTLLRITPETQIAVVEMGANHPDDIAKLVKVSQPDYGLITNVGRAHLLGFGSIQGVARAKGELYKWLGSHPGSLIFLNEDDSLLRGMAASVPCHCYGYGLGYQCASVLPATAENPFLRIRLNGKEIQTHLVGAYNAYNVLAAMTIGDYFGVPRSEIVAAIEEYVPSNNRSQMVNSGRNTLVVDAYNANPSSMSAALDNFAAMKAPAKLALLGDMRELGAESRAEHVKIIRKLADSGLDAFLVGEEFKAAAEQCGIDVRGLFSTSDELAAFLDKNPVNGTLILVKGSRGIRMENVIKSL